MANSFYNGGYGYNNGQMPYFNQQPQINPVLNRNQNVFNQNTSKEYRLIPVANKEEANATTVDLNGTPMFFYNTGTNEIYLKQFDIQTGLAILQEFKKTDFIQQAETKGKELAYIKTYDENFKAINDRLDGLKSIIENSVIPRVETIETKGGRK